MLDLFGSGYVIDHCISVFSTKQEEMLYRIYLTDALKVISENTAKMVQEGKYLPKRYADLIEKKNRKEDERTGDEIADEVIEFICD